MFIIYLVFFCLVLLVLLFTFFPWFYRKIAKFFGLDVSYKTALILILSSYFLAILIGLPLALLYHFEFLPYLTDTLEFIFLFGFSFFFIKSDWKKILYISFTFAAILEIGVLIIKFSLY